MGSASSTGVEVVVRGLISLSASTCEGPSASGMAVVVDKGGSNCGASINISSRKIGGCDAHRWAIGFSLTFIRLASSVL